MPTLDDIYRKFGEASEAAQLLETELGTLSFAARVRDENLIDIPDRQRPSAVLNDINRQTLGQLLRGLKGPRSESDEVEAELSRALVARNRLAHSFFRQHNFRRNNEEGRSVMMRDLESLHETIFEAYKSLMRISGVDLDNITANSLPLSTLNSK